MALPLMGGCDNTVKKPSHDGEHVLPETAVHRGCCPEGSQAASAHKVQGFEQHVTKVCNWVGRDRACSNILQNPVTREGAISWRATLVILSWT
jgi:hypothetical protein